MKRIRNELVPQIEEIIYELDGDVFGIITGIYGGGKSTLGGHICGYVYDDFKMQNPLHCGLEYSDILSSMTDFDIKAHLTDEGKRAFGGKMDFRTKQGVEIEKVLSESRQLNRLELVCVGEFDRILGFMSDERALIWLHIVKKGEVLVFERLGYKMRGNKFGIDNIKWDKIKTQKDFERKLIGLDSFRFRDSFPKYSSVLTKQDFGVYKQRKKESFLRFIEGLKKQGAGGSEKISMGRAINSLKRTKRWSWLDIAELFGYSDRHCVRLEKDYLTYLDNQ